MTKTLGIIQKEILNYLWLNYQVLEKKKEWGNVVEVEAYDLICEIYKKEYDGFENIPLRKKQIIYNAIDGLKKREWIDKTKETYPYIDQPPDNYLIIQALILDDKIWNLKDKKWEEFKNLIG